MDLRSRPATFWKFITKQLCVHTRHWFLVIYYSAVPYLSKKPHGEKGEPRVLAGEAVVVGVESGVIQVEEPQPVALSDRRVAADRVVLVAQPHQQDDVKGGRSVLKNT